MAVAVQGGRSALKFKAFCGIAALAVLIGCGGGGTTVVDDGGGGGGGGGGRLGATVLLNSIDPNTGTPVGFADFWFLPGQGRAAGDVIAGIRRVPLYDTNGDPLDELLKLPGEKRILLNGFNAQKIDYAVPVDESRVGHSRSSLDFILRIENLTVFDELGRESRFVGDAGEPLMEQIFTDELLLTVFPGRYTALQTFLNDAILNHDGTSVVFDTDEFRLKNINPTTGKFTAFLADYVSFDIKDVAARPLLNSEIAAGRPAARVFLSGDNYALSVEKPYDASSTNPTSGLFEVLTPYGHLQGIFRPFEPLVGRKIYDIQQADPRDFDFDGPIHLITALKGYYRDYTEVLSDLGAQEMLLFPKTGDGARLEVVLIVRDTSQASAPITAMWFGEVNMLNDKGKPGPTVKLWPIAQLSPASSANQTDGVLDVKLLTDRNGLPVDTTKENWWRDVRAGVYTVTKAADGFPAALFTGRATVFRR